MWGAFIIIQVKANNAHIFYCDIEVGIVSTNTLRKNSMNSVTNDLGLQFMALSEVEKT